MYDLPLRYIVRIFTHGGGVDIGHVSRLAKALAGSDMLLGTVHQLDTGAGLTMNRMQLTSADKRWTVHLPAPSIDVAYMPIVTDAAGNLPFDRVIAKATEFAVGFLRAHEAQAARLAVAQEGLLPEMGEEAMRGWANRLFRFTRTFSEQPPFEWTWRCVAKVERTFGAVSEPTNTILGVKRVRGNLRESGLKFDRIQVDVDINTMSEVASLRFEPSVVEAFLTKIPEWHAGLYADLMTPTAAGET